MYIFIVKVVWGALSRVSFQIMPKRRKPIPKKAKAASPKKKSSSSKTKVIDRLYPSPLHTAAIAVSTGKPPKHPPVGVVLRHYTLLTMAGTPLQVTIAASHVKDRLNFPMLAEGDSSDLFEMDKKRWKYKPHPLVRPVRPSVAFEQAFQENGFLATNPITVVPILTEAEETAYAEDPEEFEKLMVAGDWVSNKKRQFWIVDGANRFVLSKKYKQPMVANVLKPTLGYVDACFLASGSNEETGHMSNATSMLSKAMAVGQKAEDGFSHKEILSLLTWTNSTPTISTYNQIYSSWLNADLKPVFDADFARKPGEEKITKDFVLCPAFKALLKNDSEYLGSQMAAFFKLPRNSKVAHSGRTLENAMAQKMWINLVWLRTAVADVLSQQYRRRLGQDDVVNFDTDVRDAILDGNFDDELVRATNFDSSNWNLYKAANDKELEINKVANEVAKKIPFTSKIAKKEKKQQAAEVLPTLLSRKTFRTWFADATSVIPWTHVATAIEKATPKWKVPGKEELRTLLVFPVVLVARPA